MTQSKNSERENQMTATQEFVQQKSPTIDQRVQYAVDNELKHDLLPTLEAGLSDAEKAQLRANLVRANWEMLKGKGITVENTFLRGQSLFKDAMMAPLLERIQEDPGQITQFINDPISYVDSFQFPEEMAAVMRDIVDYKIEQGSSLQQFAHNIVFSAITGPIFTVDKKPETMMAVKSLTNSNRVLAREGDLSELPDQEITPPVMVERYVTALDSLLQKVSTRYQEGQVNNESRVKENLSQYHELRSVKSESPFQNIRHRIKNAIQNRGKRRGDTSSIVSFESDKKRPKSLSFVQEGMAKQQEAVGKNKENAQENPHDRPSIRLGSHRSR